VFREKVPNGTTGLFSWWRVRGLVLNVVGFMGSLAARYIAVGAFTAMEHSSNVGSGIYIGLRSSMLVGNPLARVGLHPNIENQNALNGRLVFP